jgi:peptidoglycan/LPS O-acetylase OafA/YrhL
MTENRLITELRGLAALLVMLFHFVSVSNNYLRNEYLIRIFAFGKYGVQIFFLISGFILTISLVRANYNLKNAGKFLVKRFIRIEPPFIISLTIILVMLLIKGAGQNIKIEELFTLPQVLYHLGYWIPFTNYNWLSIVYWTLAIEFQFYILLALLFPLLKENKLLRMVSLLAIASLFFIHDLMTEFQLLYWIPIFVSGITLAFITSKRNEKLAYLYVVLAITNLITFIYYPIVISCFVIVTQCFIYFGNTLRSQFLYFIGKISYSLYLTHTIIGFTLINLVISFTDWIILRYISMILIILITIGFSYYFNRYLEIPFQRFSSKIKYKS